MNSRNRKHSALGQVLVSLCAAMIMFGGVPVAHSQETVLHNFGGSPDGAGPEARLYRDGAGNLYGTTTAGGTHSGTVFKLSTSGQETILHAFTGGTDGGVPKGGLIRDSSGFFYGTTSSGGTGLFGGNGVVFKLKGTAETVLYTFMGPDGSHPNAGLVRDKLGNLYGTTTNGGTASCGCGTVFKIDTTGKETVLYSFTGGADGKFPEAPLILDATGNLYGTASEGGIVNCDNLTDGCGVIFEVTPSGTEKVLYSFTGGSDGGSPLGGLIRDTSGNLYGTTFLAGDVSSSCALNHGCGTLYKLSKSGLISVLYTFTNGADGANPMGELVRDSAGNLYGTTKLGGLGFGVVFKVAAAGGETALYSFTGSGDGAGPQAGLVLDSTGNLYGTTAFGGTASEGVVFRIP